MSALARLLRDGDLVAVRSKHGGLTALTRKVTRSPYTHTAVVVQLDSLPWVAEMDAGGNHLVPLTRYAASQYDVFEFPGDRALVRRCTFDSLAGRIKYDFLDLVRIALFNLLDLKLPRTDRGGMVCSSYSAWLWKGAGVLLPGLPSIPSPADLVASIGAAPIYRTPDA